MDQMILSEPSIIIIWTYQDMMGWMSRTLVGEMANGADEDFGLEVGQQQIWRLIFVQAPTDNPTQHDPHGPDNPLRTINYHHLDISGHDGMDEQEIGWRNGWWFWWVFWLGSWAATNMKADDFCSSPNCKSNSAWSTWTRLSSQNQQLTSSGHIRTWWDGWAGHWLEKWLVLMVLMRISAWNSWADMKADFCSSPNYIIQLSMIHMDQMIFSETSIIIIWTYRTLWDGWAGHWLEKWLVLMRILAWKLGKYPCWFLFKPQLIIQLSMIHMDQMILSEPSIIIIWTYQDMMGWMSRKLAGEMAGADEDFGLELGSWAATNMKADFCSSPNCKSNSAWSTWTRWSSQNHQLSSSGHIRTWLDGQAGHWLEKWLMVLMSILSWKLGSNKYEGWFLLKPQLIIQHYIINMNQMILSEPSIIIIWTYQDVMGWMSRTLVGEMAGADEDFGFEVGQQITALRSTPKTVFLLMLGWR
jgi:hypothetical protein